MEIVDHLHGFLWLNPMVNNCNTYFLNGDKRILIDPGHYNHFGHIRDELSLLSLDLQDIDLVIITHGHPDHMEAVRLFQKTPALVGMHWIERDFIKTVAPHYGEALGLSDFEPSLLLQEGELKVGDIAFRVLHTPGHSPGSISLYWPEKKALFSGDLVFYQGIGRTDLPGGDSKALKESLRGIAELDVEFLLPGHGQIVSGGDEVASNFQEIERMWFPYL